MGFSGAAAAVLAPLATLAIDTFAYKGENLRARVCGDLADARAAAGHPVRRVVDLGCGTGPSTRALERAWPGAAITAVDTSAEMLGIAKLTTPRTAGSSLATRWTNQIQYTKANAERTGLPSHAFDIISLQFVLHEAPRAGRVAILREVRAHAKL